MHGLATIVDRHASIFSIIRISDSSSRIRKPPFGVTCRESRFRPAARSDRVRKRLTSASCMLCWSSFSSMTCLSTLSVKRCASSNVMFFEASHQRGRPASSPIGKAGGRTLCHLSCSSDCAPSLPLPIAFASYRMKVPDGSAWYLRSAGNPVRSEPLKDEHRMRAQLRPVVIASGDQQSDAEGTRL